MKCRLHLISMPWADPEVPSIQIAALKAYVDATLGKHIKTFSYSAFAEILLQQTAQEYVNFYQRWGDFEEYPYFLLCVRRFPQKDAQLPLNSIEKLIERINTLETSERFTLGKLNALERRTWRYIEQTIVPRLSKRGLNIVGFTLNYFQLYASMFCARYLQEYFPKYKYLFIFGGATVIYPKIADALKANGLEGLCVIGEGETKLELILRQLLATASAGLPELVGRLSQLDNSIYEIQRRNIDLYEPKAAELLRSQISMDKLPLPDFDEYYRSLRSALPRRRTYLNFKVETWLALEGSRGCFAHCDFCDVHTSWSGFRKSSPDRIVESVLGLTSKYGQPKVKFMDNVCDTWAERYSELLIEQGIRVGAFMECRVHHPEVFWTKLSLAGVEMVQVGIEAFSPSLIRAMNKGTRAKQNLLVQKWLKELGIVSAANIISHHPKSTREQVAETKRVIEMIPHLDRLDFSPLALLIGSPLDARLRPEERRLLDERQQFTLSKLLDKYFVLKGEYEPPANWFGNGVNKAWEDLISWENRFYKRFGENAFMTSMRYAPDQVLIRDARYGRIEEYFLEGDTARIYQLCHQGATRSELNSKTNVPLSTIEEIVSWLIRRRLLIELEGFCIALALRPRDELIDNCYRLSLPANGVTRSRALPLHTGAPATQTNVEQAPKCD